MPQQQPSAADSGQPDVPAEINLKEVFSTLGASRALLFVGSFTIGLVALACTFLVTPKFTSTLRMMPPQQAQSTASAVLGSIGGLAGLAGGGVGALAGLKNPADQWIGMLGSRSIADALIARFKLKERYEFDFDYETRDELDARTNIQAGKDGLISIDVSDEDPAFAASLANAYVDELRKLSKGLALGEAAQRRVFFEQQLKVAKDSLVKADQALQMTGVTEGVIKSVPEATVGALAELKGRLATLEVRIAAMRGYLTDAAPELGATLREQAEVRAQLTRLETSSGSPLSNKAERYISSVRDVKYYETLFEIMARQYELARADEAREGALIQVVDEAIPAEKKSSPKRALVAVVATALGFVVLAIFVLSRAGRRRLSGTSAL